MKPLFALALLFLVGCANPELNRQANRLKKAGFEIEVATAPRISTLSRTKMVCQRGRASDGTVLYRFVNPITGESYIGGSDQMSVYLGLNAVYRAERTDQLARIQHHPCRIPRGLIDQPTSWWWYPTW